jgi:hypothetical protein
MHLLGNKAGGYMRSREEGRIGKLIAGFSKHFGGENN